MKRYASVIINNDIVKLDKLFVYKIPERLSDKIDVGYRVKVPFGNGNRKLDAFIITLDEECESVSNVKEIFSLCDDFPVFRKEDIALVKWMHKKYMCTYLECIKVLIPTGITRGIKNKEKNVLICGKSLEDKHNKYPYKDIFECVKRNNALLNKNELSKRFGFSLSSINTMIKHEYLTSKRDIVDRFSTRVYENYPEKVLNEEQKKAAESILNSHHKKFVIHGVTGSGKTEIYMHLVKKMIETGKQSIILVPEISLTPQMVERFKGRFKSSIAVFHSKLSDGERFDEWLRVKRGKVKVAIGARSAIFLPFSNLGLIVIDEEHESSYKSENSPRYHAREIAEKKCELSGDIKLVLGSATPSVETYYRCLKGDFELINIKKRADGASMPYVTAVDMREELISGNKSILSRLLYDKIKDRLEKKEQVILFLNRRGFSTFVSCRKCGYVFKCSNCDIALTYHNDEKALVCHYCGKKIRIPDVCPKCKSRYVKYFGTGTEKIEEEIKKLFPSAKTLRMDFDTTRTKNSYEHIYNLFKNKEADVLIGTQMIAKGLDFPDVTLVGVIAADLTLNIPDFHSSERTFQLITQVSGRCGRGSKKGEVIVQTYNPDNYSIRYSVNNDYEGFYNEEITFRKNMDYPPFTKIICANFSSRNEQFLIKNVQVIGLKLKKMFENNNKIVILGPCPCQISKIKDMYRWQIIIKGIFNDEFALNIKNTLYELTKDVYNDIRVILDINPNTLL